MSPATVSYRDRGTASAGVLVKSSAARASSRTPSSIPSKFETTLVNGNKEQNGFGDRTHRFGDSRNPNPGPGSYQPSIAPLVKDARLCGSVSRRGYSTGFASKTTRFSDRSEWEARQLPGPGSYGGSAGNDEQAPPRPSAAFVIPERTKLRGQEPLPTTISPGPGAYDTSRYKERKSRRYQRKPMVSFASKVNRFGHGSGRSSTAPAPGQYNDYEADMFLRTQGDSRHMPFCGFRSTSKRADFFVQQKGIPGPGSYNALQAHVALHQDLTKGVRATSAFANPHQDRFADSYLQIPEDGGNPGPGWYEADYKQQKKSKVSMSAFKSSVDRLKTPTATVIHRPPGPAFYTPMRVGKKSYHLNTAGRWV